MAELEARVRAVVPHALFVEEHVVRRAVREARGITGVRTFVPHTHVFALPERTLARIASSDELGRAAAADSEAWAILLPRPSDDDVREASSALLDMWRRLFHGRMDELLGALAESGALDRTRALQLADQVGQLPMDEARTVLEDEGLLGAHASEIELLSELVALHAELRFFAPELLARYFPSLAGRDDLVPLFDALVPAPDVFQATRPSGAPEPTARRQSDADLASEEDDGVLPRWRVRSLLDAARRAVEHQRDVDAAIAAWRARMIALRGTPEHAEAERLEADSLRAMGKRLTALGRTADHHGPHGDVASEWSAALEPLVARARWGMASVEARLLHDLQRACDDAEHPRWDVDLGRVLRSFGRAPLRRREHVAQKVAVARHLASASRRLVVARIAEAERRRLKRLLGDLAHGLETEVRTEVGGILAGALAAARLVPENLPERVSERKVVDELCDKLLDKGFIAFSDLRDLVARNQLKLSDLSGPKEWLLGDQLLVLDRYCKQHLDAAYRRGEVYRRWLQRLSSLLFANRFGRFLVRFGLLPVGGAFMALQGIDHTVLPLVGLFTKKHLGEVVSMPSIVAGQAVPVPWALGPEHLATFSPPTFVLLSVLLFGILHVPRVRVACEKGLSALGRVLSFVFGDLPRLFRALPPVAALLRTRAWELYRNHLWRPAVYAFFPTLVSVLAAANAQLWLWVGLPLVLVLSVYFATKPGRRFVELSRDWWVRAWHQLRHELLPGLFAIIMGFFKAVVDRTEVVLYTVDQWLRYRRGDSLAGSVLKAIFGLAWSVLAYVVRLIVNLVAEPQLNPIKHFPVVTVTHKFFIPVTAELPGLLTPSLGEGWAIAVAGAAQFVFPGICGFLAWEFKENWRLYKNNRWQNLRPVIVGSHGEPVPRLLRPGFHSGTVPTLFKKLRRAERKHLTHEVRRQTEELHHVEEALERFITRELKTLLELSQQFPEASALDVAHVQLTPARIGVHITCPPLGPEPLELAFEEQSRLLVAHVAQRGFLARLDETRRIAFDAALLGLYKLSGVDIVREHLAALLPPTARYDIAPSGLVVWPENGAAGSTRRSFASEVVYPLRMKQTLLLPEVRGERPSVAPTPIRVGDFAFKQWLVPWASWAVAWQDAAATKDLLARALRGRSLLGASPDPIRAEPARADAAAP